MVEHAKRYHIVRTEIIREKAALYGRRVLKNPKDSVNFIAPYLRSTLDREHLYLCCCSTKTEPLSLECVSIGSLDCCIVSVRELFKTAVITSAAGIMLFHNHPSGDPESSKEDDDITKRVIKCGKLLGIPLIDHVIVGGVKKDGEREYYSFRECKPHFF